MLSANPCNLCPRECGINRNIQAGFCKSTNQIKIARAALHQWEEPCISGKRGSGTVFFSGCTLRCCYCQNYRISHEGFGKEISVERLAQILLELQEKGAHNINLVTATQYLPAIIEALDMVRNKLYIPVVYNCGGYEKAETIRAMKGYVDIYLPDLKYYNGQLAWKYSKVRDYFRVAAAAVKEMIAQTGGLVFDGDDMLKKGVIIRHLVLPGARQDSLAILKWISNNLPKGQYLLSLMSQYTPAGTSSAHKELNRRITTYEYESVVREAIQLGISQGFMQERISAADKYIPPFDLEGI